MSGAAGNAGGAGDPHTRWQSLLASAVRALPDKTADAASADSKLRDTSGSNRESAGSTSTLTNLADSIAATEENPGITGRMRRCAHAASGSASTEPATLTQETGALQAQSTQGKAARSAKSGEPGIRPAKQQHTVASQQTDALSMAAAGSAWITAPAPERQAANPSTGGSTSLAHPLAQNEEYTVPAGNAGHAGQPLAQTLNDNRRAGISADGPGAETAESEAGGPLLTSAAGTAQSAGRDIDPQITAREHARAAQPAEPAPGPMAAAHMLPDKDLDTAARIDRDSASSASIPAAKAGPTNLTSEKGAAAASRKPERMPDGFPAASVNNGAAQASTSTAVVHPSALSQAAVHAPAATDLSLHASAPGDASSNTAAHGAFAALDSGDPGTNMPHWMHAGTHQAEAGFQDPELGWIGVRAGLSAGSVHATVVPGTADAAQVLGSHMAGLHAYLAERHTQVAAVALASPENGSLNMGSGQSGAQDSRQNTGQGSAYPAGPDNRIDAPGSAQGAQMPIMDAAARTDAAFVSMAPAGTYLSVMA